MSVVSHNSSGTNPPTGGPANITNISLGNASTGGDANTTGGASTSTNISDLLRSAGATSMWTDTEVMDFMMAFILQFHGDAHPVPSALKSEDIYHLELLLLSSATDIDNLSYPGLLPVHKNILKLFQNWVFHIYEIYDHPGNDFWQTTALRRKDFMQYNISIRAGIVPTPPSPSQPSRSLPTSVKSDPKIAEWTRGHKRDKKNYTQLKTERDWDAFNRKLIIQAVADGIENLLEPNWTASTPDDQTIDDLQNKYFFSVLEHVLLTDRGKTIIRQYMEKKSYDARAAYADLVTQMTKSTKAKLKHGDLLDFLVTSRFGENIYNVTAEHFILAFRERLRLLDELTPVDERLSNPVRLALLQKAVNPIEELRRVKTDAEILGKTHDYFEYCDLLESAAVTYDNSKKSKSRNQVNTHSLLGEIEGSQPDSDDKDHQFLDIREGDLDGGIDMDHSMLINQTSFKHSSKPSSNNGFQRPSNNGFQRPSNSGKFYVPGELWRTLSDETKKLLKDYNAKQPNPNRRINLTEFEEDMFDDPEPKRH